MVNAKCFQVRGISKALRYSFSGTFPSTSAPGKQTRTIAAHLSEYAR
jgi:hypothetical protein